MKILERIKCWFRGHKWKIGGGYASYPYDVNDPKGHMISLYCVHCDKSHFRKPTQKEKDDWLEFQKMCQKVIK